MALRWKGQPEEQRNGEPRDIPRDAKNSVGSSSGKNRFAVALGRLGGLKGGKARAEKLSARRRREIARKAAQARWKKERTTKRKKSR